MSTRRVVGVSYSLDDPAPTVVVKGSGAEAQAILASARADGDTVIVKDAALTDRLYRVPIDAPIGRELFPVMAVLLAHVLQVDRERTGSDA